jgi:endonuclease-3
MPTRTTTRIPDPQRTPVDPGLKRRARSLLRALYRSYPDAHCALDHRSPLDLYVATVLSAQCTDERVNQVTPDLFARCRKPEDYLALGREELERIIRSTGFFRAKARNILEGCRVLVSEFGGRLPRTIEELVRIPGCGRKTANVILGTAFGIPGITVDTHVQRIVRRLELTDEKDPVKIEAALQKLFPEKDWSQLSHMLIFHGRSICAARKPRCAECPLLRWCPFPAATSTAASTATRARATSRR